MREYIVKNLILFDDSFNIIWSKVILSIVMREEEDAYDLEIRF